MRRCSAIALAILLLAIPSSPKDKKKSSLPAAILRAQFVAVIVDPDAGIPLMSPGENETARSDVEAALEKWGRFKTTLNTANSDLILVVRKGGKPIKPAIGGVPNEPPVVVNPDDSGITIRGQRGTPPDLSASGTERNGTPTMRSEISSPDDVLAVYLGGVDYPLDSPPLWRYTARNSLQHPTVPAVEKLRQAIADSEKAKP
ncbi:MAG: hypothetical protein DMG88_04780 [Acidobacteria bacterium]|nr:MAG: hypothetical protein DMG88_04780 [Acidobacteriota bacterium]